MRLGDCGKTNLHTYSDKEKWSLIRYLDTGSITEGRIDEIQTLYPGVDKIPSRARRKASVGDILFSTVRPNQKHYGIIEAGTENLLVSTGFTVVTVDTTIADPYFIYYYLTQSSVIESLQAIAEQSTSTYPSIKPSDIEDIELDLPELETQKKIGSTLRMLDRKIALNEEINDNLYAQAKATTKQWISKSTGDYELLPLSNIASINPDTYSPKETWKYVNYLDTSSITEGCIAEIQHITPSSEKLPSRARRKIAPNDIVFSTVRPNQRHYGIISEPLPNMLGSTGFAVIRSKNPLVCNELIYLCLTENEFIEKMQQLAEQSTSTFPSIKPSDLGVCEIPCPKDQSSTSFTETLKSLFALIAANQRENISLSEIRDVLLPKLMSGEIDVSDIQL